MLILTALDRLGALGPYTGWMGSRAQRSLQWAAAAAAVIAILFLAFGLVAGSGR